MPTKQFGTREFAALAGRITNDSYSATIKKLALLNAQHDTPNRAKSPAGHGKAAGSPDEGDFAQIVPARLCAGYNHVFFALEHAMSAVDSGTAFSRRPELEFLINFFGEKQLHKAFEKAKFGQGEGLVLVVGAKNKKDTGRAKRALGFVEDADMELWQNGKNKMDLMAGFGIGERELEAVSDLGNALEELVIERISLVSLLK